MSNKCGHFDNGYRLDKVHENRTNCRACLLERIIELTDEIARRIADAQLLRERNRDLGERVKHSETELVNSNARREQCAKELDELRMVLTPDESISHTDLLKLARQIKSTRDIYVEKLFGGLE